MGPFIDNAQSANPISANIGNAATIQKSIKNFITSINDLFKYLKIVQGKNISFLYLKSYEKFMKIMNKNGVRQSINDENKYERPENFTVARIIPPIIETIV